MIDGLRHGKYLGVHFFCWIDEVGLELVVGDLDLVDLAIVLAHLSVNFCKECRTHRFDCMQLILEALVQFFICHAEARTELIIGLLQRRRLLVKTARDVLELLINDIAQFVLDLLQFLGQELDTLINLLLGVCLLIDQFLI